MSWYNPTTWKNKKRRVSETGPQVQTTVNYDGSLTKPFVSSYGPCSQNWYLKLDQMRKQPTLAFARMLAAAPILASDWTIDKDGGRDVDFIDKYIIQPFKFHLSKHAAFGMLDWGWQPFDIEYRLDDGNLVPHWYKPLLQQYTTIVVHENGKLHYLLNQVPNTQSNAATGPIPVHPSNSLVMSSGVEGTNWYGSALMANAEKTYDDFMANKHSMQRYAQKMAGAGVMISHPVGVTAGKDNHTTANEMIRDFNLLGGIARAKNDDEHENWDIEMMETSGGVTPFIENAKYLDSEFFRALHLSERSGLEGQFGTKAESETQKDFSIEAQITRHIEMLEGLNNHIQYITQLHYDGASAKIVPAPMNSEKIAYLRSIYAAILADPTGVEMEEIDMDELREMIGLPLLTKEKRKQLDFSNIDRFNLTEQEGADDTEDAAQQTQEGDAPLVSTNVLNGAQIQSAVSLLQSMGAGTLTTVAARELLLSLGIPEDAVERMVSSLPANTLDPSQTVAASSSSRNGRHH